MLTQFCTAVSVQEQLPGFPLRRGEDGKQETENMQSKKSSRAMMHRRNVKWHSLHEVSRTSITSQLVKTLWGAPQKHLHRRKKALTTSFI